MAVRTLAGGGKLGRSETVTVRLDPKLRYLAEIAARKQRRTLSSFIEWAIEDALQRVMVQEGSDQFSRSIADDASDLWDVDEPDRFVKLALRYPDLLTHEEQICWKLIKENGLLWRGAHRGPNKRWQWDIREDGMIFDRLRDHWDKFKAVAQGAQPRTTLPTWQEFPTTPETKGFEDDDIPF